MLQFFMLFLQTVEWERSLMDSLMLHPEQLSDKQQHKLATMVIRLQEMSLYHVPLQAGTVLLELVQQLVCLIVNWFWLRSYCTLLRGFRLICTCLRKWHLKCSVQERHTDVVCLIYLFRLFGTNHNKWRNSWNSKRHHIQRDSYTLMCWRIYLKWKCICNMSGGRQLDHTSFVRH